MNRGSGGAQPKMHKTIIPKTSTVQLMVWPEDYKGTDKDGESLAGKSKGMEQVLHERGLLSVLDGKGVGVCAYCKSSQEARDKVAAAAKSRQGEAESGEDSALADRSECEEAARDLERSKTCCMQRVLSLQADFLAEKPLLQLIIEKAGHKCLFLPKFHCELNPIEMVWGQAKRCKHLR